MKLLIVAGFAMISLVAQSQVGSTITITPTITQQSIAFKNLQGQDRKAEFLPLQALFITKAQTTTCNGSSGVTLSNRAEVNNLFGNPDEILSPNLVAYNLGSGSSACRAEIGIDANNNVLFITINNCP